MKLKFQSNNNHCTSLHQLFAKVEQTTYKRNTNEISNFVEQQGASKHNATTEKICK